MNLPAEMRRALGLSGSGRVILTQEDDSVRITTMEQSLKQIRDIAKAYRPSKGLASDSLIADRRKDEQG